MRPSQKTTLHFVQDIPTPHNNVLLKAIKNLSSVDLRIWYSRLTIPRYSFKPELGFEVSAPIVYGFKVPSWQLISTAIFNRDDKFFIVGWVNPTIRALIVIFWFMRRPYNMWFDEPQDRIPRSTLRSAARNLYYSLLKTSNVKIFAVGVNAVRYFKDKGFTEARIVNLPIFVEVEQDLARYREHRTQIRERYGVRASDVFIVTGSRLTYDKGFDLLISAICTLEKQIVDHLKVLIIGKGDEEHMLRQQVSEAGLQKHVSFEEWMNPDEFMMHLGAADITVHPARFDAYGGITLNAMAIGVPVVGSTQAGAAQDRIRHGLNGWLYDCHDVSRLAHCLRAAVQNSDALPSMGVMARATAEMFTATIGASRILEESI